MLRFLKYTRVSLSVCTDNEVCTDKLCTDSESDRGGSRYLYGTDNETLEQWFPKSAPRTTGGPRIPI